MLISYQAGEESFSVYSSLLTFQENKIITLY